MSSRPEPSFISENEAATLNLELRLVKPYLLRPDLSGRYYFTDGERQDLLQNARTHGFDYICIVRNTAVSTGQFSHRQLLNLNYYVIKKIKGSTEIEP